MTTTRIAWHRSGEIEAHEHCTMSLRDSGLSLVGTVLQTEAGVPMRIEYRVMVDARGFTTAAHVRQVRGFEQTAVALARDSKGGWTVNGVREPSLRGCTDLDLGCSPATNTLPIHRLHLGVGTAKTIAAAWLRFPELDVLKASQTYERLDEFTYRYSTPTFAAELTVDDQGIVASYAEWERVAIAFGPDDTAPLDAP
jgi:uncharacterized protein